MELDEDICVCFHVSRRKVVNFLRVEKPQRVGQLAECFGAGTGCGWCRPFLRQLFEDAQSGERPDGERPDGERPDGEGAGAVLPSVAEYAQRRSAYLDAGHGQSPLGSSDAV